MVRPSEMEGLRVYVFEVEAYSGRFEVWLGLVMYCKRLYNGIQ